MAEYALGWLGWGEEQTLAADVNAIMVGMAGRWAMLEAVFGRADAAPVPLPAAPPQSARPLSPALFDAVFSRPS
ncbi:MAG: hypothetical protein EON57_14575 [Alphaproteobacteria bacterium]|nr:MAG: hypothetical protein EON57_14575 [Alphaproteobacteria bacterium]